jgi:acetyl esterase/lipase
MRKIVLLVSLCLLATQAHAQDYWGHRLAVDIDAQYGEDPAQTADLYTQAQRPAPGSGLEPLDEPRPTLIWFHGGGWVAGDKASNLNRTVQYLERGWHVANVNYRVGTGTAPDAVDDAMCAYKWVVEEAQRTGRSERFVVSGGSAGGHLALVVGLLNAAGDHPCRADVAPSAVVNWYGITDVKAVEEFLTETHVERNYARMWVEDMNRMDKISSRYSPLSLVSDNAPPIISVHGTADPLVPYVQATQLHAALNSRNRLVSLDGGTHGGFSDAQYEEAIAAIFEFLDE